ncbi:PH domain-containing protein [Candidatus Uhrbacteria bacterium]|nr:PH domain-containing protein [Candidatus Uhrbacteria bacterium]
MTKSPVTLKQDESLVHIERQALMVFVPSLCAASVIAVVPFLFFFPLLSFGAVGIAFLVCIAGVGLVWLARVALQWRGTMCVLTTERVVRTQQHGLLERHTSEANVRTIQDVVYRVDGLWRKALKLGTVRIVFRGVVPDMSFRLVRHPERLAHIIQELKDMPLHATRATSPLERKHFDQEENVV